MILVLIAAVLVVIGVFLPWVSATMSTPMGLVSAGSRTGFQLHQGVISMAVAAASALLGAMSGKAVPRRGVALLTILASVAVVTLAANVILSAGSQSFAGFTGRSTPEPGALVSCVGGALLFIGGILMLRSD